MKLSKKCNEINHCLKRRKELRLVLEVEEVEEENVKNSIAISTDVAKPDKVYGVMLPPGFNRE